MKQSSGHPSAAHEQFYAAAQDNTRTLVFTGHGNIHAIDVQNNDSTNAVFVQFFNVAATTDVTLGTTTPDWSLKNYANSHVRIAEEWPVLKHFDKGLVIAVTTTRTGSTDTTTKPTVTILFRKDV